MAESRGGGGEPRGSASGNGRDERGRLCSSAQSHERRMGGVCSVMEGVYSVC